MKTLFHIFLCLNLLTGTAVSREDAAQRQLEAASILRETILVRLIRTDEAKRRTDDKIRSLQRRLAQDDSSSPMNTAENKGSGRKDDPRPSSRMDELERSANELEVQTLLLTAFDEQLIEFQQEHAPKKPETDQLPEEVVDHLWHNALHLPEERGESIGSTGSSGMGTGSGSGFERACPAYSYSEPEEGEESSGTLLRPVAGYISAGTWSYPGGGMHLGMDFAASMYTPVIAPADGVIVYANNPVGDGGGYLGNWVGWPYGSGNSIAMIAKSDSKLYGITFAHLSSKIKVRAGQQVRQGDVLALSGHTGNSTGPHTHVEVFSIKVSFDEIATYFSQTADFAFGTGWEQPATCSRYACRIRPESCLKR